jgi:hypothetical protein
MLKIINQDNIKYNNESFQYLDGLGVLDSVVVVVF